jgi:hypothetical protein
MAEVYLAEYCSMTAEGGFVTMAVCSTRELAQEIVDKHRYYEQNENRYISDFQEWRVSEVQVIDDIESWKSLPWIYKPEEL